MVATNQSAKMASLSAAILVLDAGAAVTGKSYESLWHLYWDELGTVDGTNFNERLLNWINVELTTSYTQLPEAMQAFAVNRSAYNWDSVGDLGL